MLFGYISIIAMQRLNVFFSLSFSVSIFMNFLFIENRLSYINVCGLIHKLLGVIEMLGRLALITRSNQYFLVTIVVCV